MNKIPQRIRRERQGGTPLVLVGCADTKATARSIRSAWSDANGTMGFATWNLVAGLQPMTNRQEDLAPITRAARDPSTGGIPPVDEVLQATAAMKAPDAAMGYVRQMADAVPQNGEGAFIVFAENLAACARDQGPNGLIAAQAIREIRDPLKMAGCMLVMLEPSTELPSLLQDDVVVMDEPYPTREELREIVRTVYAGAQEAYDLQPMAEEREHEVIRALVGLPAFAAEQAFAPCIDGTGVDVEGVWDRKRQKIDDNDGLTCSDPDETFETLAGLEAIKEHARLNLRGSTRTGLVLHLDEFEKANAGSGAGGNAGDSTGVTQDQGSQWLQWSQDRLNRGLFKAYLAVGHAGAAKSAFARALAAEAGVPCVKMDWGGMKSKWLGESEDKIRKAFKIVDAMTPDTAVLVVATVNGIASLPPEQQARFTQGIWMFDLPSREEKDAIWAIYLNKFGLDTNSAIPPDAGWTGRDIRGCCMNAADWAEELGTSEALARAAFYVVPQAVCNADGVRELQRMAEKNGYLSANVPGRYVAPKSEKAEPIRDEGDALKPTLAGRRFSK